MLYGLLIVLIANFEGNRVLTYDLDGKLLQVLNAHFNKPADLSISGDKVYVVNYKGKALSIFVRTQ